MNMNTKSLIELQAYYKKKAEERGFTNESARDTLLLLTEELGELAKAIRKSEGLKTDNNSKKYDIEEELADVFIYLLHLSNVLELNLEEAFWKKEEENNKRVWK